MGVVFKRKYGIKDLLIPFVKNKNHSISTKEILKSYYKASLGRFPVDIFWKKLGLAELYPDIQNDFLAGYFVLDPDFIVFAEKMMDKFNVALLSNNLKEWIDFAFKKFDLNKFFNTTLISADVGIRKPDERIYQMFFKLTGASPENCIFVDDKWDNLKAASELGINAVLFSPKKKIDIYFWRVKIKSFNKLANKLNMYGQMNTI